jgi:hypothetical protein
VVPSQSSELLETVTSLRPSGTKSGIALVIQNMWLPAEDFKFSEANGMGGHAKLERARPLARQRLEQKFLLSLIKPLPE